MNSGKRIEKIYPLSPMQSGILFHSLTGDDSHAYVEQTLLRIKGKIDKDLLKKSLDIIIDRHDVLRTVFRVTKVKEPLQLVLKKRKFSMQFEDISHLNKNEQDSFMEEYRKKDKERAFDLTRDILLRVSVFQTGNSKYSLWWSFHHIIMDGWCLVILYKELVHIYHRLKDRLPLKLAPVTPYMNYIKWLEKQDMKVGLRYWQTYLEGYEHQAALTYTPGKTSGYKPEQYQFVIHEKHMSHLQEMARKNQVTLNTVLQGLWGILLMKYADRNDVVFGVVVSGRPPEIEGIETMVGLFINTIPIRIKIRENPNFSQWLKTIQEDFSSARPHEYLSLAEILAKSPLKANLINHIMAVENYPLNEQMTGLDREAVFHAADLKTYSQTNYDFNISIIPQRHLIFKFSYNAFLYEKNFIEKIGPHLKEVIRQVVNNPDKAIKDIEIITKQERQLLLFDFNRTRAPFPREMTIHQLFAEQAEQTPDSTAVIGACIGTRLIASVTYRELNRKSNQLAHRLREKHVRADTAAAVMVDRSLEMIIGILAILKASGAYLPVDPHYPKQRINFMFKDAKIKLLLSQKIYLDPWSYAEHCSIIDLMAEDSFTSPTRNLELKNFANDLGYITYTSGTTGKPKGVMVKHQSIVNLCSWHNKAFEVTEADKATLYANFCFDAFVWELFPYITKGSTLHIIDDSIKLDVKQLNEYYNRHGITIGFLPTQVFEQFIRLENNSLRTLLTGADKLNTFIKKNYRLVNNYGPTENTVVTTSFFVEREYDNIPIGKPIENVKVYILNRYHQLQPIMVTGELYISGSGLSRGYLNQPELTADKFDHDLWDLQDYHDKKKEVEKIRSLEVKKTKKTYRQKNNQKFLRGVQGGGFLEKSPPGRRRQKIYKTGDLARWLSDGNISFLGRIDHQVKIRGFRIEPGEIEKKLLDIQWVKEAIVVSREDSGQDKYLYAYIVSDKEPDYAELQSNLAKYLPDYMIPSVFVRLEKIPITPTGKIDRSALPSPGLGRVKVYHAPKNEIEKKLAVLWAEILSLDKDIISRDANFFQLGGHSLKATLLTTRIHKELHVKIPLSLVFKIPTIAELSGYIKEAALKERYKSIEPVEKKDYYGLSSAQKRLYILQQMEPESTAYNMPYCIPLADDIDAGELERTFIKLLKRHESLRTSFFMMDEQPVQRVVG